MSLLLSVAVVHADEARYAYDELGRLQAVIDSSGNAAVYTYDAVGNLLSITRSDVSPTGISITFFSPQKGVAGTEVRIFGAGFSPVAAENQVTFNGVAAEVLSATVTEIVTRVPAGVTSGPITVTNPLGSATSRNPFTVILPVSVDVTPKRATLVAGTSIQFRATVTGSDNQAVTWGMEGAGTLIGTISETGLYSVPSSFTDTALVTVKATSLTDRTKSATATVSVLPSTPLGPIVAPEVSVAVAQVSAPAGPFVSPQVSVVFEQPSTTLLGPFVSHQVSVAIESPTITQTGPFVSAGVSVALTPIIHAITPNNGLQGATSLPITLTGTGLAGATSLNFLLNGATDTSITATNILANGEGTRVTAELSIASSAPAGLRVVRITTPDGTSPAALMEGNVFSVITP